MAAARTLACLIAATLLASAAPALAEEHGKPEGGHEGKEGKEGEAAGGGGTVAQASGHYVHQWLPMPGFSATKLPGAGEQESVEAKPGRMLVVVFLASWCEPCQQLMGDMLRLEKRYRRLNTDFVYVFAHDTRDDAEGYMKEFGMEGAYLSNHDVLKTFHNPPLPTIYVGDRRGWLATRYVKAGTKELAALDDFLADLTAY